MKIYKPRFRKVAPAKAPPPADPATVTLKVWTIAEVQNATNACYEVGKFLEKGWTGTIEQIIALPSYPLKDLLWIVTHPMICPHQIAHPYRAWKYSQALALTEASGFTFNQTIPRNILDLATKGKVMEDVIEAIWDTTDRTALKNQFLTLLDAAKGTS